MIGANLSHVAIYPAKPEIWMTDLDRGNSSPFVIGPTLNSGVVWSPDGTRLIFRTNRNGVIDFYQKSAAGGGNEEPVVPGTTWLGSGMEAITLLLSDWSRQENVIFSVPTTSGWNLGILPLTANLKPVTLIDSPFDQMHGNFSPDGRFAAYSSNESGRFEGELTANGRSPQAAGTSPGGAATGPKSTTSPKTGS
jgi:Tol biopolymer transport system component